MAEALRDEAPAAFGLLASLPMGFRFHDEHADIRFRVPVLGMGEDGRLAAAPAPLTPSCAHLSG